MRTVTPWDVDRCRHMARSLMRQARRHYRSGLTKQAGATARYARLWWTEANRLSRLTGEA